MTALADTSAPGGEGGVAALEVASVVKSFGGLHVLEDVSLRVQPGEIFGIAGPNGAGKTTLLNIVTGVLPCEGGSIAVFGTRAENSDATRMANLGVARTFQNIRLLRGLTAREQVMVGAYRHRRVSMLAGILGTPAARREKAQTREQADQLLALVGLADHGERIAETLPYGHQRRIEIARALATRPRVLLLDEPTAGMGVADWSGIAEMLQRMVERGITLILVEHNIRLLESICDRVAVLAAGEVIACDTAREALGSPAVRRAYFGS